MPLGVYPHAHRPLSERFWAKVDKSGECWVWTAARDKRGYGRISRGRVPSVPLIASRVSWELHFGPVPSGMAVCHHCDNPPCVRPEHLFLGTDADNQADKWAKGRGNAPPVLAGQRNPMTRLTTEDVVAIKLRARSGERQAVIARAFGVTRFVIHDIVRGKTWRHIN